MIIQGLQKTFYGTVCGCCPRHKRDFRAVKVLSESLILDSSKVPVFGFGFGLGFRLGSGFGLGLALGLEFGIRVVRIRVSVSVSVRVRVRVRPQNPI